MRTKIKRVSYSFVFEGEREQLVTAEVGFVMASSSRIDYEIISDPLNPRCVVACFNYSIFGEVTEEDKLLLERIRGKEDNTSPKYTDQEERNLINKQIRKSQVPLSLDPDLM